MQYKYCLPITEKKQYNFDILSKIKIEIYKNNRQNAYYFGEDEESIPFDIDNLTVLTEQSSDLDNSAGNAAASTLDAYELYKENICFKYRGPKVLPINETPVTIYTVNTICCLCSRNLLQVLFDSGSTGCLFKRSA